VKVRARAEAQFDRRWTDYVWILEEGTPTVVGTSDPRPPDLREAVQAAYADGNPNWDAANAVLDKAWAMDARNWKRRLEPFLQALSTPAQAAFTVLVEAGYQADMLALQFHEATQADEYEEDHAHLQRELDELNKLGQQALEAVQRLAARKTQLDEYLMRRRLSVIDGEPGDAELKMLVADLADLVRDHAADNNRMRRQLDGRRNPLLGHAEVRLSLRVRAATGAYHDVSVERILEEIRQGMGYAVRAPGTLKKRRQRWLRRIGTGVAGPSE
jgi:hypothetical protein